MKAMGSQVFRCGSLGAGQATKIVNNLVCIANMMIAAEAYRIAQENNIVLDDAMAVFEASTGRNFFTSQPSQAAQAYGAWTRSREGFDTLQGLLRKDVDLALSMGRHVGPLPMAQALQSVLKDVGEETFATWRAIASP
jgi:3-hydroxyisobutyrate dehydrogenase-like beta-hydroxyacid dehydrogenase